MYLGSKVVTYKFGLFYQFTWRKKSVGNAQSQEVYFSQLYNSREELGRTLSRQLLQITTIVNPRTAETSRSQKEVAFSLSMF